MITVGDFVLRHKKINSTRLLPLEKIEVVEGDSFVVYNRFGATSNVSKTAVIELDTQYEVILWDELIQLEQQILFLMDCEMGPDNYRLLQGTGIVCLTEKPGIVNTQETPWSTIECNSDLLQELSNSRLVQVETKLTELEEQHDFLIEALESLW